MIHGTYNSRTMVKALRRTHWTTVTPQAPHRCHYGVVRPWQHPPPRIPPMAEHSWDDPGILANSAASVVMKIMYAARMARFDLLRPVQGLARFLTTLTKRLDKQLHRLMSYITFTKSWRSVGWIGDPMDQLQPVLFTDADITRDAQTQPGLLRDFCVASRGPTPTFPSAPSANARLPSARRRQRPS